MTERNLDDLDVPSLHHRRGNHAGMALRPVNSPGDLLEPYRGTPIESLLIGQNTGQYHEKPIGAPDLIIATCIDPRIVLKVQSERAFVIRTAGVNLKNEAIFQFVYLSAMKGIRHIALIAHEDCAMTGLLDTRQDFIEQQVKRCGCEESYASLLFDRHADFWDVPDAITVVLKHAQDIRQRCAQDVVVAPLFYTVGDNRLLQIEETGALGGPLEDREG